MKKITTFSSSELSCLPILIGILKRKDLSGVLSGFSLAAFHVTAFSGQAVTSELLILFLPKQIIHHIFHERDSTNDPAPHQLA